MGTGVRIEMGCGVGGYELGRNDERITASAGEHTQHCLWIMVLKQDKYRPEYGNIHFQNDRSGFFGLFTTKNGKCPYTGAPHSPIFFNVTPCTGGCLYPTYGVGTVFEGGGDTVTITEAIYPSKIVMRSKSSHTTGLVITYTIVATPGGAEIGIMYEGVGRARGLADCLNKQVAGMKRVVEAEAQAILAESPLPSEDAVRQLQPAAGTMITVPQGSSGGQQLTVQTASGPVTCVVPEGMVPGNQFMIRPQEPAPGPAPVPMQQAPIQQQPAPIQDQVVAMQQQPVPAQTLAKFCTSCGTRAVAEFCSGCGARVV